MAGTRTAPAFTAAATSRLVTLHAIDASGDKKTVAMPFAVAATAANIETWIAAYQAATNSSVWAITDSLLREGDADPDNAVAAYRASVESGINLLFKNPTTTDTIPMRLFAPIAAVMQGNQDIPLLSATEAAALITATLALITGYQFNQAQYTGRKERKGNPVVR